MAWFPIAIIATVFSFVLIIIKMSQEHEEKKLRMTQGSDKSMTVTELNDMIEKAVAEAMAPLRERLENLEAIESDRDVAALPEAEVTRDRLDLDALDPLEESPQDPVSSTRKRVQ